MNKISLKEFKSNFNSILNTVPTSNKLSLIANEIKEIENFIKFDRNKYQQNKKHRFSITIKPTHIFDISILKGYNHIFARAFNDYNLLGKIEEYENVNDLESKAIITQAHVFVRYYNWLKRIKIPSNKTLDKLNLNIDQKLLALQFLGMELRDFSKIHSAVVLSQILDCGDETIRRKLSNLYNINNKVRTSENLEKILNLFDNQTFNSISSKIKKELRTIK